MKKIAALVLALVLALSVTAALADGITIAIPNDATNEGYVAATGGSTNKGKVWKISSNGTPTWLEESTGIYVRANPSYTTDITGTAATDPYLVLNNTISNTSSV